MQALLVGGPADGELKDIETVYPTIRTVGDFEGRKAKVDEHGDEVWHYPTCVYRREASTSKQPQTVLYHYSHTIEPGATPS